MSAEATESLSSYWKALFTKTPALLEERKSEKPMAIFQSDHPDATDAELKRAKSSLNNVKSMMKKDAGIGKPRKPRAVMTAKKARKQIAAAANGNGHASSLGTSLRDLIESIAREAATAICNELAPDVARDTARQEVREALEAAAK